MGKVLMYVFVMNCMKWVEVEDGFNVFVVIGGVYDVLFDVVS